MRSEIEQWLKGLQAAICERLEELDGKSKFSTDNWDRSDGGGGISRVISDGKVFEKGGVMYSAVHGKAPAFLANEKAHRPLDFPFPSDPHFYAAGVSIVIHPQNPHVPIIHMNTRYFELCDEKGNVATRWLGGGIDLTPHYVVGEDAIFFHNALKSICDKHHDAYYPEFKKWADDYFFIQHRNETRGVGGIFFDRLNDRPEMNFEQNLAFWKDVGSAFAPVYTQLVTRHVSQSITEKEKQWQLLRRGRYVEFNLIYDKGTKFGLESGGRIESILVSLPKHASWEYNFIPEKNSKEEQTLQFLRKGIDWV